MLCLLADKPHGGKGMHCQVLLLLNTTLIVDALEMVLSPQAIIRMLIYLDSDSSGVG